MNTRALTGLSIITVTLICISHPLLITFFTYLVSGLIFMESTLMAKIKKKCTLVGYSLLFILLTSIPILIPVMPSISALIIGCFLLFLAITELYKKKLLFDNNLSILSLKFSLCIGLSFPFLIVIYQQFSYKHLLYLFICIWVSDTFAYIFGKWFGKHKISKVSPKKTYEGSVMGLIVCTGLSGLASQYVGIPTLTLIMLSIAINLISQIGDFHQSLIKRRFNTKDSSHLLPGHGGFYDRYDSLLFVLPLYFWALSVFLTPSS